MGTEPRKEHEAHKSTYSVLRNTAQVPGVLASCFPMCIGLLRELEVAVSWYAVPLTSVSCVTLSSWGWSSGAWYVQREPF